MKDEKRITSKKSLVALFGDKKKAKKRLRLETSYGFVSFDVEEKSEKGELGSD